MKTLVISIVLGLGIHCAPAANASFVANPGMEAPAVAPESFHTFWTGESFGGWTVSQYSVDLCGVSCWQAAEGSQSIDLGGSPGPGVIYQDLSLTPGQTYRLRFAMAGDPFWPGIKEMKVYWAGGLVADLTFDTTPYNAQNMGWEYHSYLLTAAAPTVRLQFEDINHTDGYYGAALDDVSVEVVPEASSLMTLAGGVGALATLKRRRCQSRHT